MKSAWFVVVLVSVVLAGTAWAQVPYLPVGFSPESMAMGMTGTGVATRANAWYQNPAGLAWLAARPQEGKEWGHDVAASYISIGGPKGSTVDSLDTIRINWSTCKADSELGVGAGYMHVDAGALAGLQVLGGGAGVAIGNTGLAVGANIVNLKPTVIFGTVPDETLLGLGAMYRINQGGDKGPIRIGLVYTNATDEAFGGFVPLPSTINAGVCWPITNDLTLAVDVMDVLEDTQDLIDSFGLPPFVNIEAGFHFNGGLEYRFGSSREWAVRAGIWVPNMSVRTSAPAPAGSVDVNPFFTAGIGYNFGRYRVEGAWMSALDLDATGAFVGAPSFNSTWTVGAGMEF